MKKLLLILFLNSAVLYAQPSIALSFRGEVALSSFEVNNARITHFTKYPAVQSFSFAVDGSLNNFILELRLGHMLIKENYEGFELGGFIFYNFPGVNYYLDTGINYHFNGDEPHNGGGPGETISQLVFGLGYRTSQKIALELTYYYPLKQEYGFYDGRQYKLLNMVKFGVAIQII